MHGRLTNEVHTAGIAVESAADDRDVDVDNVAIFQAFIARDAMAHHMVDGGADGLRKTPVIEVRRHGLLDLHDVVMTETIELVGGHAGFDVLADHVEHFGGQTASLAHHLLLFGGFQGHGHV